MKPRTFLTEDEIRYACENTTSLSEAARFMHVSYPTFLKYAGAYFYDEEKGITWRQHHANNGGKGKPRRSRETGKLINGGLNYIYKQFVEGKRNLREESLIDTFIREGVKRPCCEKCGYDKFRTRDFKLPILVHIKDGNRKNTDPSNFEFLCYNCYFASGYTMPLKKRMFGGRVYHKNKEGYQPPEEKT